MGTESRAALVDPRFVTALAVMLANDLVGKTTYPGVVSGKLSDVAGMVVFPVLISILIGALPARIQGRSSPTAVVAVVVMYFVGLQVVPSVDAFHEAALSAVLPWVVANTMDATDLVAVPFAVVGYGVLRWPMTIPGGHRRTARSGLLCLGLLACIADSPPMSEVTTGPVRHGDGSVEISSDWVYAEPMTGRGSQSEITTDEGQTWERIETRTAEMPPFTPTKTACHVDATEHCFSLEDDGRTIRIVEELRGDSDVVWHHPKERYLVDPWVADSLIASGIVVFEDGSVLAATGSGPTIRRTPDGTWSPSPISLRRETGVAGKVIALALASAISVALSALSERNRGTCQLYAMTWSATALFLVLDYAKDMRFVGVVLLLLLVVLWAASALAAVSQFGELRIRERLGFYGTRVALTCSGMAVVVAIVFNTVVGTRLNHALLALAVLVGIGLATASSEFQGPVRSRAGKEVAPGV